MLPEERLPARQLPPRERGRQGNTLQRLDLVAVEFRRIPGSGQIHASGHDVDDMPHLRFKVSSQLPPDARRPVSDQGRGDAPLVNPVLVFAKRGVGHVRPGLPVTNVGVGRTGHHPGSTAHPPSVPCLHRRSGTGLQFIASHGSEVLRCRLLYRTTPAWLRTGAVVLQKKDEGVVKSSIGLELGNNPANALVHPANHGGVGLHVPGLPRLVRHPIPFSNRRSFSPAIVEQSQLRHPLPAGPANGIIPLIVFSPVSLDVLLRRLQRPVGSGVGDIKEEGCLLPGILTEERHRVVADRIGVIKRFRAVFGIVFRRDEGVLTREAFGIVEAAEAANRPVEPIESPLHRPVGGVAHRMRTGHMPLPGHRRVVARRLQHLGDRHGLVAQVSRVSRCAFHFPHHEPHPCLVRVEPGEERRTRGTAARAVVELREAQPVRRQRVELWSGNLAAVTSEIGIAHVIGEDEHDIRSGRRESGCP